MTRHLLVAAALAGCATPTASVRTGVGEEPVRTGTVSAPSPVEARPHTVPKASRSRRPDPLVWTGSQLDVTCYAYTGHRTASGKWPQVGMAASNQHPFGTRLHVESIGVVTVEDRIGHGTDLDLYGPSERYCRRFGRQRLFVQVIR